MVILRPCFFVLLASLLNAQQFSTPRIGQSNTQKPTLRVVDDNACPGKGNTAVGVKVTQNDRILSSWDGKGKPTGTLRAGDRVTILGGVDVVREAGEAVIKFVGPDLPATGKVGDAALVYGIEADGSIVFWSNGAWFSEDIESVAEKGACGFTSGFGLGGCTIDIVQDGVDEWWVQVRTSKGETGWVLASGFKNGKRWFGNFSDLCHYGED
jgi:hypothetical protein